MHAHLIDSMGSDLSPPCKSCGLEIQKGQEVPRRDRKAGYRSICKTCFNAGQRKRYTKMKDVSPFKLKCSRAKARAKELGLPFDLTPEYLESLWTGFCPLSGEPIYLNVDRKEERAAELDRFIPSKGYVQGNVTFLSRRFNRLKNNVSIEELEKLLLWMKERSKQ